MRCYKNDLKLLKNNFSDRFGIFKPTFMSLVFIERYDTILVKSKIFIKHSISPTFPFNFIDTILSFPIKTPTNRNKYLNKRNSSGPK